MKRRTFVQNTSLLGCSLALTPSTLFPKNDIKIMTVLGKISPDELGVVLIHEHLMADFVGAKETGPHRYNINEVVKKVLPHLMDLKEAGCNTFVDCTATFLGRDAKVAKRLSIESGLHIITNTGNYAALEEKFLPAYAYKESAEQLSYRWISEWKNGIGNTSIFPGIIKIGMDNGPLIPVSKKLIKAAALAHLKTGLSISGHTGDGKAAMEQLQLLQEHGVSPEAFRWVHAQNEKNFDYHLKAAELGAYVEFDYIRPDNIQENVDSVTKMKDAGFLTKTLISQDAGWYWVGEPNGGDFAPYTPILNSFIPTLKSSGFTQNEIDKLLIQNPMESLIIKKREL